MESYFELVVETLTAAGYRWYETANFCRAEPADGRDLRSQHNLGYWLGHDYLGLGVGAVSTIENAALAERSRRSAATWRRSRRAAARRASSRSSRRRRATPSA